MGDTCTAAVYGATGALGKEVRIGLEGLDVDIAALVSVAGVRSAGEAVPWHGGRRTVVGAREVDLATIDLAVVATPRDVAREEIPRLRERGIFVVDLSGARAAGPGDPLPVIWPHVAIDALEHHPGGFALPGAAASTVAPILHALVAAGVEITGVDVVELATAGDFGREGPVALSKQTVGLLGYKVFEPDPFREALAFNVLDANPGDESHAERFTDELHELLPALTVPLRLTTVFVPAFAGVAVTCTVRTAGDLPTDEALAKALDGHPDLELVPEGVVLRDAMDSDTVHVSPPRRDPDGTVRIVAVADPLHRIGQRAAILIKHVLDEELW